MRLIKHKQNLDHPPWHFQPSFQLLICCPRQGTFQAAFFRWGGEISARLLSGSPFRAQAGAVGGASRPRPRPSRLAPRLGRKPFREAGLCAAGKKLPRKAPNWSAGGRCGEMQRPPGARAAGRRGRGESVKWHLRLRSAPGVPRRGDGTGEQRTSCPGSLERIRIRLGVST